MPVLTKEEEKEILSCHLSTTRSQGFGFQLPLIKVDDCCDIFVDADNRYNIFSKLTIVETFLLLSQQLLQLKLTIITIFFLDVELFTLTNL